MNRKAGWANSPGRCLRVQAHQDWNDYGITVRREDTIELRSQLHRRPEEQQTRHEVKTAPEKHT
jgi:hypothetical protein